MFSSWGTGGSLSWRSFSGKSGVVGRSSWIGEWSSEPWEAWLTVPTYCFTRTLYEPNFSGICAIYFDLKVSDSPFFRGKNTWIQNLLGFFWFGNQAEKKSSTKPGLFCFCFPNWPVLLCLDFPLLDVPAIHLLNSEDHGPWEVEAWGVDKGVDHGWSMVLLVGPVAVFW